MKISTEIRFAGELQYISTKILSDRRLTRFTKVFQRKFRRKLLLHHQTLKTPPRVTESNHF